MTGAAFVFIQSSTLQKRCSCTESTGGTSSDDTRSTNENQFGKNTRSVVSSTCSSLNSVTFITIHGPPNWCVSATEDGYHNRNLIQPFYSQEETHCIPSNNRHCLNIHVALCNKSNNLLHTLVHLHAHLLMCTYCSRSWGCVVMLLRFSLHAFMHSCQYFTILFLKSEMNLKPTTTPCPC